MFESFPTVLALLEGINVSEFVGNITRYGIQPYLDQPFIGDFFWGILFGFIMAGVYVSGDGDPKIYLSLMVIMIIALVIFGTVLSYGMVALIGLLLAFIISGIFYKTFVESRT